jgi:hypothetical protein
MKAASWSPRDRSEGRVTVPVTGERLGFPRRADSNLVTLAVLRYRPVVIYYHDDAAAGVRAASSTVAPFRPRLLRVRVAGSWLWLLERKFDQMMEIVQHRCVTEILS